MNRFFEIDPAPYRLPSGFGGSTYSPALVVFLDEVRRNVRRMIDYVGGEPGAWRPHVKTAKIPEVFAELVRAGLRHFKCATTREAQHLLQVLEDEGVQGGDVLLAYPLVGPALARLGELADAFPGTRVSVLCEDPGLVELIPRPVSIFIDVNPGMNRTGVPQGDFGTIHAIARGAGPRFRGLHYYDGHLHEGARAERNALVFQGYDSVVALASALARDGAPVEEIVTAGTPAFLSAVTYPGFGALDAVVHRVSPGTVVYHDMRTEEENPDLELSPAALVFSRVVSHPTPTIATCDAGSKALAAEAGDPCAFALGHPELVAQPPNEEHLPLRCTSGARPARGSTLLLFPRHVCPTVNLAEEAVLVEGGEVKAVVQVRARAHDLRVRST